jgi:hypothetical protein
LKEIEMSAQIRTAYRLRDTVIRVATLVALLVPVADVQAAGSDLADMLATHATNKQRVLDAIEQMPPLALTRHFGLDATELRRRILIDGTYAGTDKAEFLDAALKRCSDSQSALRQALASLRASHRRLFGSGNLGLMVRYAADPGFLPFGRHLTPAQALADICAGNGAEVQAFQTIFETGQNARGYVHKLECHAQAVEFIYAVTDIVYGVMLPTELDFRPDKVVADPKKVQMVYVRASEVIALHPYVLHSGSLSVEPDRSFSIVIYKKPVTEDRQCPVQLPQWWRQNEALVKLAGIDKFYLTLKELHTDDLKNNRGFIADRNTVRLPTGR